MGTFPFLTVGMTLGGTDTPSRRLHPDSGAHFPSPLTRGLGSPRGLQHPFSWVAGPGFPSRVSARALPIPQHGTLDFAPTAYMSSSAGEDASHDIPRLCFPPRTPCPVHREKTPGPLTFLGPPELGVSERRSST